MKTIAIILLSLAGLVFLYVVFYIYKGIRAGKKPTPDDLLHDLNFKIQYCEVNDHSELYLIQQIKELRIHPDIDKERLNVLDIKFRQRFSSLHESHV